MSSNPDSRPRPYIKLVPTLILVVLLFTRFVKLDWGDGYFFHPDENNMASAVAQFSPTNLNPHFFAYGQFPLYLGYFSLRLAHLTNTFSNSVLILRLWSAFFSVVSVTLIYLIVARVINHQTGLVALVLATFNPGLIQVAHFGTTESLLIFDFLILIYLSLKIYDEPLSWRLYFLSGVFAGLGLASKISALIFLGPVLLSIFFSLLHSKKIFSLFLRSFITIFFAGLFFVLFSPYNLIAKSELLSSMAYETQVATGKSLVFYTSQFIGSIPYLFQIGNIFPYVSGIFQFVFAFVGIYLFSLHFPSFTKRQKILWSIVLIPSLVYFLYFGQLYVKWTRFVSPVFFIFPFFSAFFITQLKSKWLQISLVILACIPGIVFTSIYLQPDIRLIASKWLISQLPENSTVLSEGGNVVNLPLGANSLDVENFDFYQLDNNIKMSLDLSHSLRDSEYVLVPSRRIFKNQNTVHFNY